VNSSFPGRCGNGRARTTGDHRRERGAVALVVVLVIGILLGFLGFVLNVGHATSVEGELQNATDAAALAAGRELNGRASGILAARRAAAAFARAHATDTNQRVDIDPVGDVRFCNWDPSARVVHWCLPWGVAPTGAPPPLPTAGASTQFQGANAVQVRGGRESRRGNALPVWFSAFLGGTPTLDMAASSTGVGGGPSRMTRSLLPVAFLSGPLSGRNGIPCNSSVVYVDRNQNGAGFTDLDQTGTVSIGEILNLLGTAARGGTSPAVDVTQVIGVRSDVSDPRVWNRLRQLVGGDFPVPVVYSESGRLQPHLPIVGFASVRIAGVYRDLTDHPPPACRATPCFVATLTCDQQVTEPAGGGLFGLAALTSRMVQ